MSRKAYFLVFLVLLVCLAVGSASGADPDLIGWWKFDDGSGTIATDSSGLGNDGKFGPEGTPKWVAGKFGGAIYLDGADDYINIDVIANDMPVNNNITVSAWILQTTADTGNVIGGNESAGGHDFIFGTDSSGALLIEADTAHTYGSGLANGQWHMITYVRNGTTAYLYIDGVQVGTETAGGDPHREVQWSIGQEWDPPSPSDEYLGAIDDVRFYKRALTVAEIQVIMKGEGNKAEGPSPTDKATDIPRDATLSWRAGPSAAAHDVYFGTALADVNTASRTSASGVLASQGQTETTFDPAGLFAYGQTYYWRVDEVNQAPDNTIFKGDVWSFTAEPYGYPITGVKATASSSQPNMGPEKTVDGSGLTGDLHSESPSTMWLSLGTLPNWIQYEFDAVYKLDKLLVWNSNQMIESFIGFGAKDVTVEYSVDGVTWTTLAGVPPFSQANGSTAYAANTTVNFGGIMAKYVKLTINNPWGSAPTTGLSEVRFSYIPTQAHGPQPATGATGESITPTLNWRPGREAASHKVFFGTDPNAVANGTADAQTVTDHAFAPGTLAYGATYYWKVDEVNAVTYPGNVWSFTAAAYGVVEDFDNYNDTDNRVYDTWIDGLTDGKSGSLVGWDIAPFAEQTLVHGGKQSLPLRYDNASKFSFSETTRTFAPAQNWTASGIKSLSLWFRGAATNTGGQLYLKINGAKVAYNGPAGDIAKGVWVPWNLDLSTVGAGVSKVTSLTVGVEGSGSKGTLYVDDIRLYPKAPEFITPVDPGKTNLMALWALDGDAKDSSGKGNNGTVNGPGTWVAGQIGQAMQFNGTSTWVDCGSGASLNLTDAITITAWIKPDFTATDRKIAGNQDNVTGGYKLGVYTNNFVELEIRTSANANRTTRNATSGGTALQQGVWYHVAATYTKSQYLRTYVFGNLDRELGTSQALGTSTGSFKLGREPFGAGSNFWLGALDDVRVYNKVLSPEELLWVMGQTTPIAKPF